MNVSRSLLALLVFPGLLYALPVGWLILGLERKLRARMQGRIGPPLSQPFLDLLKLLGKTPVARVAADRWLLTGLPLLAVGSMIGALALLPVFGGQRGFAGDLILLVTLLELPPMCLVLAGYASRSIYGEVGATREAVLTIASNVPFLTALVAMATAAGSLQLGELVAATPWSVRLPALASILLCLPVKLRLNPFSVSNAEQEILAGPLTEFDGRRLALWELAHGLEWVALSGFVVALAVPVRTGAWWVDAGAFALLSVLMVVPFTVVASATGRLKLGQATRLLWRWPSVVAGVALAVALFARQGGR
jgi:NADH-quinone oxidoreductase subunit H